jgi:hypothetical protein
VLQPDGRPQAVSVRLGISDGSVTELLAAASRARHDGDRRRACPLGLAWADRPAAAVLMGRQAGGAWR